MSTTARSADRLMGALTRRLAADLDDHVGAMMDDLWSSPELDAYTEPRLRDQATEIARANLRHELECFCDGGRLPDACPEEAARGARAAVDLEMPITVMLACYRAGHAVLWRAWSDLVEREVSDEAVRRRLLETGSEFMFAYVDRCAAYVEAEYANERDRRSSARGQVRMQAVRDVLDGRAADDRALGYRLDQQHLGVVASGAAAEATIAALGGRLARDVLIVAAGRGLWWAWLGGGPLPGSALRDLPDPADATIALGTAHAGLEGFRETHREAALAFDVAARAGAAVTSYEEVSLEANLLAEPARARAFVALHLGPLAEDDDRTAVLRETLEAYLACGANAASAAARLGVTDRTVSNRVRTAEELLGGPAVSRSAELQTALRLGRLLGTRL